MKLDQIQAPGHMRPDPKEDGRHVLRQDPVARESIPYMVVLPEHRLTAFVYTWVGVDSKAGAACCVFGPGIGPQPVFEKTDGIEVPRTMDFDRWEVAGIRLCQDKPLETAHVAYRGKRVSLDLQFRGFHPAYGYAGHPRGCPREIADDRFEQSGLVKGILTVDGREIPFDTTGHRDHSWGTRDWSAIQHWKWFQGQAGADMSVHFFDVLVAGKTSLRGYVYKDGLMAEVTRVDFDFEHDTALAPLSMDAVVHDDAGRSVRVTGTKVASYPFLIGPATINIQSGMDLKFDGAPAVGWLELSWPKAYLEYMSQRKT